MSTASITHRPAQITTILAAAAATLAFGVAVTLDADHTGGHSPRSSVGPDSSTSGFTFEPTTSGGKTMIGLP